MCIRDRLQIVGVLPKCVEFMQTTKIPLGSTNATVWSVFLSGFSIALALFIAKWIGQFFEKWINSLPTMESNVRVVIIRVVKVVLVTDVYKRQKQCLYRALSPEGSPKFETIFRISKALKLTIPTHRA